MIDSGLLFDVYFYGIFISCAIYAVYLGIRYTSIKRESAYPLHFLITAVCALIWPFVALYSLGIVVGKAWEIIKERPTGSLIDDDDKYWPLY